MNTFSAHVPMSRPLSEVEHDSPFSTRHLGPSPEEQARMLAVLGCPSLADLLDKAIPLSIRTASPMQLPRPVGESEALAELRAMASRNRLTVPMIGLGYHGTRELCRTPALPGLPRPLHRPERTRCPRVHPRSEAADRADGSHGRGRRQAAHRLRVPRADHQLPGGRDADDRAHRE